jgi:hypothetical protein
MKRCIAWILTALAAAGCATPPVTPKRWYPEVNARGDALATVFESRIPCLDCQAIKFGLALYRGRDGAPSTYRMARVYVAKGNERTVNEGAWSVARGTKLDPQAPLVQLDGNAPAEFRAFWVIGENILFILDRDLSPRVGTAGYGYALNRVNLR